MIGSEPHPDIPEIQILKNPSDDELNLVCRVGLFFKWLHEEFNIPDSHSILAEDDDWAIIIKANAIIEAALNQAITKRLGEPKLIDFVCRLDLQNRESGKMAIVKDLAMLPSAFISFIRKTASLRNQLAHNISKCDFSFDLWLRNMDSAEAQQFRDVLKELKVHDSDPSSQTLTVEVMRQYPKQIFLLACAITVLRISGKNFGSLNVWP